MYKPEDAGSANRLMRDIIYIRLKNGSTATHKGKELLRYIRRVLLGSTVSFFDFDPQELLDFAEQIEEAEIIGSGKTPGRVILRNFFEEAYYQVHHPIVKYNKEESNGKSKSTLAV